MKIAKSVIPIVLIVTAFSVVSLYGNLEAAKVDKTPEKDYIPIETLDALKKSDIDGAIRGIRMEAATERLKYLLREMQRIEEENTKKVSRRDHRGLYNVGIAYHNLYLLLKGRGIDNDDLFNKALKYYKLAYRTYSPSRKNNINLTMAALYAAKGDLKKAEKTFQNVNTEEMPNNFQKYKGLSLYYASLGDTDSAIQNLEEAFKLNPDYTKFWVSVSDDFNPIYNDDAFQMLLKKWNIPQKTANKHSLSGKEVVY